MIKVHQPTNSLVTGTKKLSPGYTGAELQKQWWAILGSNQ